MPEPIHGDTVLLCESCGEPIKGRAIRITYGSIAGPRFTRARANIQQDDYFHADTGEARKLDCAGPAIRPWGDRP